MIRTVAAALIATAALGAAASGAQAATTGTIKLNGRVDLACSVGVVDLNQSLNLVGGDSNKTVGTVTETCNSGTGYRISLTSENSGKLKAGTGAEIAYTVSYDGQNRGLAGGIDLDRNKPEFNKQVELKVSVQGSNQHVAGTYADTVTITIAAK